VVHDAKCRDTTCSPSLSSKATPLSFLFHSFPAQWQTAKPRKATILTLLHFAHSQPIVAARRQLAKPFQLQGSRSSHSNFASLLLPGSMTCKYPVQSTNSRYSAFFHQCSSGDGATGYGNWAVVKTNITQGDEALSIVTPRYED
jgi:hypothetical protein